jgi:uncharacterized protein (TIGR01244 family)
MILRSLIVSIVVGIAWVSTSAVAGNLPDLDLAFVAELEGGIVAGSQPTSDDLVKLKEAGVATVIDLRPGAEDHGFDEAAAAKKLGLVYLTLPVAGAADVTMENARKLDALLAEHPRKALVHCASGNRVGALLALRAAAAGQPTEEALALGKKAGMRSLEDAVRRQLQAPDGN